jgi:hypothetical protein
VITGRGAGGLGGGEVREQCPESRRADDRAGTDDRVAEELSPIDSWICELI